MDSIIQVHSLQTFISRWLHTGCYSRTERHVVPTWRSALCVTRTRTSYQLRLLRVPPSSRHTTHDRTSRKLPASVLRRFHLKAKLQLKMETGSFRNTVWCCGLWQLEEVLADTVTTPTRNHCQTYDSKHTGRFYTQLHCESTLHHSVIHL